MEKKSILILFSRKDHKPQAYERIFNILKDKAKGREVELFFTTLDELWIEVKNNRLKITDPKNNRDIKDFDFVEFNWWGRARQHALATATYLNRKGVPFLSNELVVMMADNKIGETAILADNNVTIPNTFISSHRQILKVFKKDPPIDYPLIIKDADACGGRNNFLINDYKELERVLYENPRVDFIVQEYIPNDCDYRCLIFGGDIKLIIKRSRAINSKEHVNNTSKGGVGVTIPLDFIGDDLKHMVLQSSRLLGRDQFSGADVLINKYNDNPYILEVNQSPEIEEGANPGDKITALYDYIESMIRE